MLHGMKFRRTTTDTVSQDLRALADFLELEGIPLIVKQDTTDVLNSHLDDMLMHDTFGTEGQHDPRGDHRE